MLTILPTVQKPKMSPTALHQNNTLQIPKMSRCELSQHRQMSRSRYVTLSLNASALQFITSLQRHFKNKSPSIFFDLYTLVNHLSIHQLCGHVPSKSCHQWSYIMVTWCISSWPVESQNCVLIENIH